MTDRPRLILASASATRVTLLRQAGLIFEAIPAEIDERALEEPLVEAGGGAAEIALALAGAKAAAVAREHLAAMVVGADQTLELAGRRFNKPANRDEAAEQLRALAGKVHWLHTAAVVHCDGERLWDHVATARLAIRALSDEALADYLDRAGDAVLASVGAYQIEGPAIQLFEDIHGDYFSILGLPLLPLLAALREHGALTA